MGSQRDVEAVRAFYDAWSAGRVEDMLAVVDDNVVLDPVFGLLYERSTYVGREGIRELYEDVSERWGGFRAEVEQTRQADGEVIAFVRLSARRGGRTLEARLAAVCRVRDGRICSLVGHDADEIRATLDARERAGNGG